MFSTGDRSDRSDRSEGLCGTSDSETVRRTIALGGPPERRRQPPTILNLPGDVSSLILGGCDETDAAALRETCRALRRTVAKPRFKVTDFLRSSRRLRWAVKHLGMPLTSTTFALAAKTSSLYVLRTLRNMRCAHDSRVCTNLARRGHVKGLQWARKNGFMWNFLCCAAAVDGGSAVTVRWLGRRDIKCPCGGTYHAIARPTDR